MHNNHSKNSEDTTLLKVVGAVMCVASIPYLFFGLPLSLIVIGLPLLALGIAMLYYGIRVYGLKKGSEVGAMVVLALNVMGVYHFSYWPLLSLIGIAVIYSNRDKFVN